jgi:hypothetical protein
MDGEARSPAGAGLRDCVTKQKAPLPGGAGGGFISGIRKIEGVSGGWGDKKSRWSGTAGWRDEVIVN